MPAKTLSEKVDEFAVVQARLSERLDWVGARAKLQDEAQSRLQELLADVRAEVAVLGERLTELKRQVEESARRSWALLPPVIAVLIGTVLGAAIQFALLRPAR